MSAEGRAAAALRFRPLVSPWSLIWPPVTCRCCVVGPDVEVGAASGAKGGTKGLFGLSFDEVLRSEWVQDDTITFKVRPSFLPSPFLPHPHRTPPIPQVVVKESSMQHHPEHAGNGHIVTGIPDYLAECPSHIEVQPLSAVASGTTVVEGGKGWQLW